MQAADDTSTIGTFFVFLHRGQGTAAQAVGGMNVHGEGALPLFGSYVVERAGLPSGVSG
jgi:hypothetical protein